MLSLVGCRARRVARATDDEAPPVDAGTRAPRDASAPRDGATAVELPDGPGLPEGPWIVDVALRLHPSRDGGARDLRVYSLVEGRWLPLRGGPAGATVRAAYGDLLMALDGDEGGLATVWFEGGEMRAPFEMAPATTFHGTVRSWVRDAPERAGPPIEGAYIAMGDVAVGEFSPPPEVTVRPSDPPTLTTGLGWLRYCGAPRTDPRVAASAPVRSDREGRFTLPLRGRFAPATVCAPGHIPQNFAWMHRVERTYPPAPLDLRLQRALPITGRVLDEAGRPVAGALVETQLGPMQMMPDGILNHTDATLTGDDGGFSLDAPEGETRVVAVRLPGRRPVRVEATAGARDLVLRAESFSLPAALAPLMRAVFHREGGVAENLVLEADGTFRAEAGRCASAAVVEGRFTPSGGAVTLSPSRAMRWSIRGAGVFTTVASGPDAWLDGARRARMVVTPSPDGSLVLRATQGGRALRERYVPGAECAACSEAGLMAGRLLRTAPCPGHAVQRWDNGSPEALAP